MLAIGASALVISLGAAPPSEPARLAVAPVCYGGRLSLDRRDLGHLPLAALAVTPGFHLVELHCPGRPRWSQLVFAAPGTLLNLVPEVASAAPREATAAQAAATAPPPAVSLAGRASVGAEDSDRTAALEQVWAASFTPGEPSDWRLGALVDTRHAIAGEPVGTAWHLHELLLTTPAHDGARAAAGRWQRGLPGAEPASTDGARLLWRRGGADLSADLGRRVGVDRPAASVGAGVGWEDVALRLFAERADGTLTSLTFTGAGEGGGGFALQGTAEGRDAALGRIEMSARLGPARVAVRGRWQARAARSESPFLAPPPGLVAALPGSLATMSVDVVQARARLGVDLEAGSPGAHGTVRAGASSARLDGELAAARLDGRHGLPDVTRLRATGRWHPAPRWRLESGAGPERVQWPGLAPRTFGAGEAAAAFALAPDVWLRLQGALRATDRRVVPTAEPRAGTVALHLEVW